MRTSILLAVPALFLSGLLFGYGCTMHATPPSTASVASTPPNNTEDPAAHPEPQPPFLPPRPATGPALCRGNFLKPEQGKAALDFSLDHFAGSLPEWQAHAAHLRAAIQPRHRPLPVAAENAAQRANLQQTHLRGWEGWLHRRIRDLPIHPRLLHLLHPLPPPPAHSRKNPRRSQHPRPRQSPHRRPLRRTGPAPLCLPRPHGRHRPLHRNVRLRRLARAGARRRPHEIRSRHAHAALEQYPRPRLPRNPSRCRPPKNCRHRRVRRRHPDVPSSPPSIPASPSMSPS